MNHKIEYDEYGFKVHRSTLKLTVNPILRKLQFFTNKPFVIASKFENGLFVKYKFMRVRYFKNNEERVKYLKNKKEENES